MPQSSIGTCQNFESISGKRSIGRWISVSLAWLSKPRSIARSIETIKDMAHEMVASTKRQVEDGRKIRSTVESVSEMVKEMFDNMEQRRLQSAEVVMELETMKNRTGQI